MGYGENDEFYTCGRCKLLNYWLYDRLKRILPSPNEVNFKAAVLDLHSKWNKFNQTSFEFIPVEKRCKPDSIIPTFQDIEGNKRIHEHCLNYYGISKNSINNDECQEYKDYIQSQSLKYEQFESLFPKDKDNCTTYYKHCKSYDPKNLGTDSNCPHKIEIAEASGDVAALSGQTTFYGGGEREIRDGEQDSGGEENEAEVRGVDGGGLREDEEKVEHLRMAASDLDPGAAIRSGSAQVDEQGQLVLTATEPSAPNSSVMPVGLSLFGIASFSTILYKFTPLRSVFYKLIHKNKSPINHQHEVPEELLEYMITSGSNNRDNRPNYIAYHPA
ncbi:Plasmodium vivax Vir protein, putative [Plasmodium vivax]|uniref:Vir protein, putative n=1 Tax=Plasmodium vivax TaxID=5855 RepID=A0A1G4E7U6_PLAVI|nr:Plasmodium vivax Vir protein, putative [Plasmodium vivax]